MANHYIMYSLNIQNAVKDYKTVKALKGLNLQIQDGEFFGLLGPNGAGKSTLIKSIVGLLQLTSGKIDVFDFDVVKDYKKSRAQIGYSPQEVNLERFFSIEKTLQFQAGYFGANRKEQKERVQHLLEQFGLLDKAKQPFYKLSGGMQKRVLIIKALVSKPRLLILDEPTAGVDVEQRHELWRYLRKLNQDGTTILLTTHYIDEAEELCERIGVIDFGEIKEIGSPKALIEKYCEPEVCLQFENSIAEENLKTISGDFTISVKDNRVFVKGERAGIMIEKVLAALVHNGKAVVKDIAIKQGDLEDVFLKLVGRSIHEETKTLTKK